MIRPLFPRRDAEAAVRAIGYVPYRRTRQGSMRCKRKAGNPFR